MSIFTTIYFVLVLIAGTVGNFLIIAAVYINARLQTTPNYLLVNLAVSEILRSLVAIPLRLALTTNKEPPIACDTIIAIDTFFHGLPNWNLVLIALDRFVAATKSMSYKRVMKPCSVRLVVVSVWVVMMGVAILPLAGWGGNGRPESGGTPCELEARMKLSYVVFECMMVDVFPFIVLVVVYSQVLLAVHGQVSRQRRREGSVSANTQNKHASVPTRVKCCADHTHPRYLFNQVELRSFSRVNTDCLYAGQSEIEFSRGTTKSESRSIRSRPDAGRLKCIKATRNVSCIIISFALLCFPTMLWHFISMMCATCDRPENWGEVLRAMLYFNACMNVFIYGWCNRTFRKTFYKMFRTIKRVLSCSA